MRSRNPPKVTIDTRDLTPDKAAQEILLFLGQKGFIVFICGCALFNLANQQHNVSKNLKIPNIDCPFRVRYTYCCH
jgi:hypothetical protein